MSQVTFDDEELQQLLRRCTASGLHQGLNIATSVFLDEMARAEIVERAAIRSRVEHAIVELFEDTPYAVTIRDPNADDVASTTDTATENEGEEEDEDGSQ